MAKKKHPLQILDSRIKRNETDKSKLQDKYYLISLKTIKQTTKDALTDNIRERESKKEIIIKDLKEKRAELLETMLNNFAENIEYIPAADIPEEYFTDPDKQKYIPIETILTKRICKKLNTLKIYTIADFKNHYEKYGITRISEIPGAHKKSRRDIQEAAKQLGINTNENI